jgi:hypothetical protein
MRFGQNPLMKLCLAAMLAVVCSARSANAQRVASYGLGTGAAFHDDTKTTAAFSASFGLRWQIPWLIVAQRSVADLRDENGTLRDVSLAIMPSWEPFNGILLFAIGASLHDVRRDVVGEEDDRRTHVAPTGAAGLRIPIAGEGVSVELLGRADMIASEFQYVASFGVRFRPGAGNTLLRGERAPPHVAVQRAAVWNDVVMQLILLQQTLESFSRIKEIETGIELEFDQASVTVYDDVAKAARVLAAAEPPVIITVFAPNAGRAGAAVTAGSFPAERLRLQRDSRVYLRVEH